jgi:serine/threonine protein kinase
MIERSEKRCTVVLCDFGLAVQDAENVPGVCIGATRGFAAPELLLGGQHTKKIDMWPLGITLFMALTSSAVTSKVAAEEEILTGLPDVFDRPEANTLSADARDLIRKPLMLDPRQRLSAKRALAHRSFDEVRFKN